MGNGNTPGRRRPLLDLSVVTGFVPVACRSLLRCVLGREHRRSNVGDLGIYSGRWQSKRISS